MQLEQKSPHSQYIILLIKSPGNHTRLTTLDRTMGAMFDLVDPTTTNRVNIIMPRYNIPSLCLCKSLKFFCHDLTPIWALNSLSIGPQFMILVKKLYDKSETHACIQLNQQSQSIAEPTKDSDAQGYIHIQSRWWGLNR